MERRDELAWAAGFFDGEGSTIVRRFRKKGRDYVYPGIFIAQTADNREVLDRWVAAVGVGAVRGPYRMNSPSHSTKARAQCRVSINRTKDVLTALALMWPWLGTAKREQAKWVLRTCVEARSRNREPSTGQVTF